MSLSQNANLFFLLEGNVNLNSLAKFQVEKAKNRRDIAGQNFVVNRTDKYHENPDASRNMIAQELLSKHPYHDTSENAFLCR